MSAPTGFKDRVAGYTDVQLAQVLAAKHEYTPDAVTIVLDEWNRRKLTVDAVANQLITTENKMKAASRPDPTRPIVIKGIGVMSYGKDYGESVGYTTTQWFCVFFIPIVPLKSFHVKQVTFGAARDAVPVRLNTRQVVRTYLFFLGLLVLACVGGFHVMKLYERGYDYWALGMTGIYFLAPLFWLEFYRRLSRRERPNKSLEPTPTAVTPPAGAGDRAGRGRGSP